jgi:hypothetical protein
MTATPRLAADLLAPWRPLWAAGEPRVLGREQHLMLELLAARGPLTPHELIQAGISVSIIDSLLNGVSGRII